MSDKIKPGDIISPDNGEHLTYVFGVQKGYGVEFGINACSKSWIADGRRDYADEIYVLDEIELSMYDVVGHYGDGSYGDGMEWYKKNKEKAV